VSLERQTGPEAAQPEWRESNAEGTAMFRLHQRWRRYRYNCPLTYPAPPTGFVIYAIGDVHGRADLLAQLHERIDADKVQWNGLTSVEIYLGDYVDRGPASARVLDILIARQHGGPREREIIFLKGNHEELLEAFLDGRLAIEQWRKMGGLETLLSYGVDIRGALVKGSEETRQVLAASIPKAHRTFLASLRSSLSFGAYYFVHAGVRPEIDLDRQDPRDLLWIRDEFLTYSGAFGSIIVHGHSPTQAPQFLANRINLDTAAYATGRLTCLRIAPTGMVLLDASGTCVEM
jgi:serine/threonine protein phosphatase 1